ncbi:MAG TPA: undecaprenyl-diphosphate phosphatase [Vicinamibacterales bacterium]|nr:undecaprenyl-diphosphate phosphatase [Vicinamibacterales bacterium]
MNLPAAVLLGIVQGITEFLPVSSSAHLILARAFFGWEAPPDFGLAFDVALHVGTLCAILAFFRSEVAAMTAALPSALSAGPGSAGRLVQLIAAGTVPVVVVGLLFADVIERTLRTPGVAGGALAIGAVAMLAAERLGPRTRAEGSLSVVDAVLIGCAQASALVPGVSRSGSTIAVGMFLGIRRDAAARFTFLLAIPAMIAAAGKEALELGRIGLDAAAGLLIAVGVLVSATVGYLTIKYFLRFLAGHKLDVFAYYRLVLAGATTIWLLGR